jgi:hypothetical protein
MNTLAKCVFSYVCNNNVQENVCVLTTCDHHEVETDMYTVHYTLLQVAFHYINIVTNVTKS